MINLGWKEKWIDYESISWSGTENQCSREISISLPYNPYDTNVEQINISLGDIVFVYDDDKCLFIGVVTSRDKSNEVGTVAYVAKDFMHYLLKSDGTYKFTNTTPEKITKKVCSDIQVPVGSLAKTKTNIKKMLFEEKGVYDIIVAAYRKAKAKTGKKYMPVMQGKKVAVIEKGLSSGVCLTQGVDITNAIYRDTTDNMVNLVKIYNDSLKKLGQVQSKKNVEQYGIYQKTYTKEKGVNAKTEAKAMMVGITQEASIDAIGDVRAVSGTSIDINDPATGLTGTFFITSDTHVFSNGVHTMKLGLSWDNEMEAGAETVEENGKKELANSAKCYYLESSSVYHSSTACSSCKGKNTKKTTVGKIKKIKITSGKNKGKRKYKACSKCWMT